MKRAFVLIREAAPYRREAFVQGLRAIGFQTYLRRPENPGHGDVIVMWNRYGPDHELAGRAAAGGAAVIVAENGYVMPGGGTPKWDNAGAGAYYSIALDYANGNGRWFVGDEDRWSALGIELKPWRTGGDHVLILPNRSFGAPGKMMDPRWTESMVGRMKKMTDRPVRVREHPGNGRPSRPLAADLEGCYAAVIWYSTAGLHALINGIPVMCYSPGWIAMEATSTWEDIEAGRLPDRLPALRRMAWAQWRLDEIAAGIPFVTLLKGGGLWH